MSPLREVALRDVVLRQVVRVTSFLRDAAVRTLYRAGWAGASRLPAGLVAPLSAGAAALAVRADGSHLRTLRANLAAASGRPASDRLARAAVRSYLRTFVEVLALPGWSPSRVLDAVVTVDEDTLRTAYADGGAVVALPHSANWDLAGAWACGTGMPVTTVAERLADVDFDAFVAFREGLGMQVLSHRDPATLPALVSAVRNGRLVCLVADRDLEGTGLAVRWGSVTVTMPGGPALVARRSGAALIPAACSYTPTGMRITFGAVVPPRPGRDGLQAMTQQVADFFADQIARQPEDWHMFQPFFGLPLLAAATGDRA